MTSTGRVSAVNDAALQAATEEWSAGLLPDSMNLLSITSPKTHDEILWDLDGSGNIGQVEQALLDIDNEVFADV